MEDFPDQHNRIVFDKGNPLNISFIYNIPNELIERRKILRRRQKKALRRFRTFFLNSDTEINFGHPCGTVRFGSNAKTSVLDPWCRAYSIDNLYVADSSFMPTSGGVNPGLTIAANALRVADRIISTVNHG